jgi:hypothetical protein
MEIIRTLHGAPIDLMEDHCEWHPLQNQSAMDLPRNNTNIRELGIIQEPEYGILIELDLP